MKFLRFIAEVGKGGETVCKKSDLSVSLSLLALNQEYVKILVGWSVGWLFFFLFVLTCQLKCLS